MNPDEAAFAIVMALHHGHNDEAARILCDLVPPRCQHCDPDEQYDSGGTIASVVVCLALALDQAWLEQCDTDGVPFDEFAHHAGTWLAGRTL